MTGRFIVLEGPDGVGKTALARHLGQVTYEDVVATLPIRPPAGNHDEPLVFVPKRQVSRTSAYAATLMGPMASMLWHSGDAPDLPDSFWAGLQAAWFSAHSATVLQPLLDGGYDVLTDGWTYKLCSKLLLQGYTQQELAAIFARVRKPDGVILLTADITALFARREFRPAELGMHAGYTELSEESFVHYQTAGLQHLKAMARVDGWPVVELDPDEPAAESAARVKPIVARLRAGTPVTATGKQVPC